MAKFMLWQDWEDASLDIANDAIYAVHLERGSMFPVDRKNTGILINRHFEIHC